MELFMTFLLYLLLTLALFQAIQLISRTISRKHPPGPTPLPIIGNILSLGQKPHKSLTNLANVHGPLMTLKLGSVTTVVISSASVAKEILQKHDLTFSDRTVPDGATAQNHHQLSVAWMPVSPPWRNLRKICNSHLFTVSKLNASQALRLNKVQELLARVQESCRAGQAIDLGQEFSRASLSALSNVLLSLDMANSDTIEAKEFNELVECIVKGLGKPNFGDYFPLIRKFDLQNIKGSVDIYFSKMIQLFDRVINRRLKAREMEGYVPQNDILETLLTLSEQNSQEMDMNYIKHLFVDLFVGGIDTTSNTLEWAMAELLHNPVTLAKAKSELEQEIGRGRLVEESNIGKLPYLQAIIKETLRLHPPGPLLLPRKAGEDVEISGFIVPKGALVLINAWAIGRDPSSWGENPDSFLPERFLGSDIDVKGRNFELIPFGGGRRMCPGLALAMRMVHLMLGSLINKFDWKLEDGVTPETMNMEDQFAIALQKEQPLVAIPIPIQVWRVTIHFVFFFIS